MKTSKLVLILFKPWLVFGIFTATAASALGQSYTWSGTLDGTAASWNVDSNWGGTPNPFPNAIGDIANLTGNFTAAKTINLNQATTVGSLTLQDTTTGFVGLTLAPAGGSLIFDNTGSTNASLTSAGAANTISAGLLLNDSLDVTTTTSLTLTGLISSTGAQNLNKVGTAGNTLTITNNSNSYTGSTSIANGTLVVTLNGDIAISTNSVLGNSATAIIHGTAASNANSAITFNAGSDAANYTISRGIDFSQGAGTNAASINFNSDGAGSLNTNTLTLAGNLTFDDTRSAALRAQRSGMTINVTGNITQTVGTTALGLNTFASGVGADGRGAGTIRFSNFSRNYVGANNLIMGGVLIDGTVGAVGTPSPIGQAAVSVNQGSGGNLLGGANFNGIVTAPNDTSPDTIRSIFLDTAGSSYARVISPGTGTASGPAQTGSPKIAPSYVSNVGVINGFIFGGKNTTGSVSFGGAITPGDIDVGNSSTNQIITAVNMALIAESGGTTIFGGAISDTPVAATEVRVSINQFRNHANIDGVNNTTGNAGNFVLNSVGSDGLADTATANVLVGTAKTGTVALSAANTYVGNTEVLGGTLQIGNARALGHGGRQALATGNTTVFSGAVLDLNGQIAINEPIILSGSGISSGGVLINTSGTTAVIGNGVAGIQLGSISGTGSGYLTAPTVTIVGNGSGATATASLGLTQSSISSISGGTGWITGDVVNLTGGGGSGATAVVTASGGAITALTLSRPGSGFTTAPTGISKNDSLAGAGGTFVGNAANFTVAGLNLTAAGTGYSGTPTYTLGGNAVAGTVSLSSVTLASDSSIGGTGNIEINAVVSESGSRVLTKIGDNMLTLTGDNTYTGGTTVSDGVLLANNSTGSATGTGTVAVSGGSTLGGTGNVSGQVNVSGILSPGASIESLGTGNLNFLTGSTFAYELDSASLNGDLLDSTGTLDIASGTILTLTDLPAGTLGVNSTLTLISYFGAWNNGMFTYLGNPLADGSEFTLGTNTWKFDYDAFSGGTNFADDQAGASRFVTMTVVPEPAAALLGGLGFFTILRRRRAETARR